MKSESEKIAAGIKYLHICEACGKEEYLSAQEGFDSGWDYPPRMGEFGIISPRTCGNCTINKTLWFRLAVGQTRIEELSEKDLEVYDRIINEPSSLFGNR